VSDLKEDTINSSFNIFDICATKGCPGHPDQKQTKKVTTRKRMMRIHERITE